MDKVCSVIAYVILVIALLSSYILMSYYNVYEHELAHKRIYEYFGCKSKIYVNCSIFGCNGETIPINCSLPKNEYIVVESLHSINEIVSYNLTFVMQSFYIIGVIIVTAIFIFSNIQ